MCYLLLSNNCIIKYSENDKDLVNRLTDVGWRKSWWEPRLITVIKETERKISYVQWKKSDFVAK